MTSTRIPSSVDGSLQQIRVLDAGSEYSPLMVALHSWYGDAGDPVCDEYAARCRERGWHLIFPEFRGPNTTPVACASDLAITDVLDAVTWAKSSLEVDHNRVFLAGHEGGAHMALMLAAQAPAVWTAVSAWSPITDLVRWHAETRARTLPFAQDLETICGGPPGLSEAVDREYAARSPLHALWRAHIVPLDIVAGIHDGHEDQPVPVGQSIRAFNKLAHYVEDYEHMIGEDVIAYVEEHGTVPDWCDHGDTFDPTFPADIRLRRTSKLTRLTIYDGGRSMLYDAAFSWFGAFCAPPGGHTRS